MAFGQAQGPPAGQRQLDRLAELFERAGYSSFREARHPFGLTQRQAGGKFTVDEADSLIERLEAAEAVAEGVAAPPAAEPTVPVPARTAPAPASQPSARRAASAERRAAVLSAFDDRLLVDELERRGWCCIPPIDSLDDDPG
jgi:hypothetical protein